MPAFAQAYDLDSATVVSGTVTIDRTTPGVETYTINNSTPAPTSTELAVVDLAPLDMAIGGGPINLLPAGNIVTYVGDGTVTDFTILNRIVPADPTRPVQFNGSVISEITTGVRGGNVWFYSPGGIIAGAGSSFDVGSLLMATADPTNGTGIIFDGSSFDLNVNDPSNPITDPNIRAQTSVIIQTGATINATNDGSYVALVAPGVQQNGTVNVNGSAAYVAAEDVSMTFNAGLFDVMVLQGSNANSNTPLIHGGSTIFPNDAGPRRAYFVAVPKNDAITMLVNGSNTPGTPNRIGFSSATGVTIENGIVHLVGGADILGDLVLDDPIAFFQSNITLDQNLDLNADVNIVAAKVPLVTGVQVQASVNGSDVIQFAGDLNISAFSTELRADSTTLSIANDLLIDGRVIDVADVDVDGGTVALVEENVGALSIGGNVLIDVSGVHDIPLSVGGGTARGGTATLTDISVGGTTDVIAQGVGFDEQTGSTASPGIGGNIVLNNNNNNIFAGAVTLDANGLAGDGTTIQNGANGSGGAVQINQNSGTLNFNGGVTVTTDGVGGAALGANGGAGTGGTIDISALGGTLTNTGNLLARSEGRGGVASGTGSTGGIGAGGGITFNVENLANFQVTGNLLTSALGNGGAGGDNGANGDGGTTAFVARNGSVSTIGSLTMSANAIGGTGTAIAGTGTGGSAIIQSFDSASLSITNSSNLSANGQGSTANTGSDGIGGTAQIIANGSSSITAVNQLNATAQATGGLGTAGNGGDATGGSALVRANGSATVNIRTHNNVATGIGGATTATSATGGTGTGGSARIEALGGTITSGNSFFATANGQGGSANSGTSVGGTAIGGTAAIDVQSGGTFSSASSSAIFADANGGTGFSGGIATGGSATLSADGSGSSLSSSLNASVFARGTGGNSVISGGNGGNATGGLVNILSSTGGVINVGNYTAMDAVALGGNTTGTAGNGGNANGGNGLLQVSGPGSFSTLALSGGQSGLGISITGAATGGSGSGAGFSHGSATSGGVTISASGGGIMNLALATLASTRATGGSGGAVIADNGGDATGGTIDISVDNGTINATTNLRLLGSAYGGSGINGGNATGSTITIQARDGLLDFSSGTVTAPISAFASGGQALVDVGGGRGGGNGGDATGGEISILAGAIGSLSIGDVRFGNIDAFDEGVGFGGTGGIAGSGGNGIGGPGGDGGTGVAGITRIFVLNPDSVLSAGAIAITNDASGGAGGNGTVGGDGGDALARIVGILTTSTVGPSAGGSLTLTDALTVDGSARGGNGGNGSSGAGGVGGSALPGAPRPGFPGATVLLGSRFQTVNFTSADLTIDAIGGDGGVGTGGRAAGGTADSFVATATTDSAIDGNGAGVLNGDSLNLQAVSDGGLGVGDVKADSIRGRATINNINGFTTITNVNLNDGGLSPHPSGEVSGISITNGFVSIGVGNAGGMPVATGTLDMQSPQDVGLFPINTGMGFIEVGNLVVNAGGTLLTDLPAAPGSTNPDNIEIDGNATLNLGGDFTFPTIASINIEGALTLNAGGLIDTGDILSGGGISLSAVGPISTGLLGSFSDIIVNSAGDNITIGSVISRGNFSAGTPSNLSVGDINLEGSALLTADGLISLSGDSGALSFDIISTDVDIAGGSEIGGPAFTLNLPDPDFPNDPIVFNIPQTQSINLRPVVTGQPIFIGGTGSAGNYSLDNTEIALLRAETIVIEPTGGVADVQVGDITLQGSEAATPNLLASDLFIGSNGGNIIVTGEIRVDNAGLFDSIELDAEDDLGGTAGRIEVITDLGGRIGLFDSSGDPTGDLSLEGNDVWVGSDDLISSLTADVNFTGRDDQIAQPDGTARPEGNLQANYIQLEGRQTIFVQNSNTDTLRGGFTAISEFVLDEESSGAPVLVAVNGRIGDGNGGFLVNNDTLSLVAFEEPDPQTIFSADSTVNGCALFAGCPVSSVDSSDDPATIAPEVRDIADPQDQRQRRQRGEQAEAEAVEEQEEQEEQEQEAALAAAEEGQKKGGTKKSPIVAPITVVDNGPLENEIEITEPISGTGNPAFQLPLISGGGVQ